MQPLEVISALHWLWADHGSRALIRWLKVNLINDHASVHDDSTLLLKSQRAEKERNTASAIRGTQRKAQFVRLIKEIIFAFSPPFEFFFELCHILLFIFHVSLHFGNKHLTLGWRSAMVSDLCFNNLFHHHLILVSTVIFVFLHFKCFSEYACYPNKYLF